MMFLHKLPPLSPMLKASKTYFENAITVFYCLLKGALAKESPNSRNAMPSPRYAAAPGAGGTSAAARPKPPPCCDTRSIPGKGPPERPAGGDASEALPEDSRTFPQFSKLLFRLPASKALPENSRTFPQFPKLPPELRAMIWHMAAEDHTLDVNLVQRCRCFRGAGEFQFLAKREPLRERLALLHTCRESRGELAPLYDAFEYNITGMVEAPGDLFLQPGPAGSGKPELSWAMDHRYVPSPPMPWHYKHPHMLVDCRRDTFRGMLTWQCAGYWVTKCHVEGCAFKRPEIDVPLDRYDHCVRQRFSKTDFEMIEILPPEESADDGAPLVADTGVKTDSSVAGFDPTRRQRLQCQRYRQ